MGAEAVRELLVEIDMDDLADELRARDPALVRLRPAPQEGDQAAARRRGASARAATGPSG